MSPSNDTFHSQGVLHTSFESSLLSSPTASSKEDPPHSSSPSSIPSFDDGQPTDNVHNDLLRVLELIHSERHLIALSLFLTVEKRLKDFHLQQKDEENRSILDKTNIVTLDATATDRSKFLSSSSSSPRNNTSQRGHVLHPLSVSSKTKKNKSSSHNNHDMTIADKTLLLQQEQQRIAAWTLLQNKKQDIDDLKKRCVLFQKAKTDQIQEGWIFSQTFFGISTFYRREDDGTLTMKLEGELNNVPLFEQLAILREIQLFRYWAPFCCDSRTIAQIGNIDMIGYLMCGSTKFGLSRDVCFRVIGCDSLREEGKIILVAEGIGDDRQNNSTATTITHDRSFLSSDPIIHNIELPSIPKRFGAGRMTLRRFEAIVDVFSPTSARTRIISSVDPNLSFIPQALLDFIMRKMCGVLLYHLQSAATKLSLRPDNTPYAERIRYDPFYRYWLVPKFQMYCDYMGWKVPPIQIFDSQLLSDGIKVSTTIDESRFLVSTNGDSLTTPRTVLSHDGRQQAFNSPQSRTSSNPFVKRRIKKELEQAHSREVIMNSLRPMPFREEQLSRLKILRGMKQKVSSSSSSNINGFDQEMNGNFWLLILHPSHMESLLTGAIPQLPHQLTMAIYSVIMFFFFYATWDEKTAVFDVSMDLRRLYWPLRSLQLISFSIIYYLLIQRTLITIFDTIELPGTSTVTNDKVLASSRKLFIRFTRKFCQYLIGGIFVISFAHGIFCYVLWSTFSDKRTQITTSDQSTTWDSIAVDNVKYFMSYSAVFIISLLLIAHYVTPIRKLKVE